MAGPLEQVNPVPSHAIERRLNSERFRLGIDMRLQSTQLERSPHQLVGIISSRIGIDDEEIDIAERRGSVLCPGAKEDRAAERQHGRKTRQALTQERHELLAVKAWREDSDRTGRPALHGSMRAQLLRACSVDLGTLMGGHPDIETVYRLCPALTQPQAIRRTRAQRHESPPGDRRPNGPMRHCQSDRGQPWLLSPRLAARRSTPSRNSGRRDRSAREPDHVRPARTNQHFVP
jgi:hypothetical protein